MQRLRDGLDRLAHCQTGRVWNASGALRAGFGPPPSDEENLTALVLAEELTTQRGKLGEELHASILSRLGVYDVAAQRLDAAAARFQEALGLAPAVPQLRAALHYNLYRVLATRSVEERRLGDVAAGHYREAVALDASLAEISGDLTVVRVLSSEPHTALMHVRDPAGQDRLVRVLDFASDDIATLEMQAIEAQSLTEWNHPHLAKVLAYCQGPGWRRPYLLMEFIEGVNLDRATRNLLAGGRRPTFGGALFEMRHIFSAVRYLHSQQPSWVLRTLNPRDVFLTRSRGLVLTDFGLNDPATRNRAGDAIFLAPEVRAGQGATIAADIYSLARVFCFLLAGGPDLVDGLEHPIAEVLYQATHADPAQRFVDVRAFRVALAEASERLTRLTLTATEGPAKGRRYNFDRWQSFVVGRDPNADFNLTADGRVSRRHIQIELRPAECRLQDLASANGTLINGWPKTEERIFDGDIIQIGDSVLRVDIEYPGQPRRVPTVVTATTSTEMPVAASSEAIAATAVSPAPVAAVVPPVTEVHSDSPPTPTPQFPLEPDRAADPPHPAASGQPPKPSTLGMELSDGAASGNTFDPAEDDDDPSDSDTAFAAEYKDAIDSGDGSQDNLDTAASAGSPHRSNIPAEATLTDDFDPIDESQDEMDFPRGGSPRGSGRP